MNDSHPGDLARSPCPWLQSPGEHQGIVISSRIRLARNIEGKPFKRKLDRAEQQEVVRELISASGQLPGLANASCFYMQQLNSIERTSLIERHLISSELASGDDPAAVVVSSDETVALMINEEDHARIQCLLPGLRVDAALARAVAVDNELEAICRWAVDDRFGYLTTCPTNTGTGLRASVMLHLPVLAESKELNKALRGLSKLTMTARGLYGEGSEASGHLYQISNQRTLGLSEEDICDQLLGAVERLIEYELMAREHLANHLHYRDRIHRSHALLRAARRLTSDELLNHLSWLRLGMASGEIDDVAWLDFDRLFCQAQPAHLQLNEQLATVTARRDEIRAKLVREVMR